MSGHRIEAMPLAELETRTHPENPKAHDIPELVKSIRRLGMAAPVLLCERTGMIAAGHGRVEALAEMSRSLEDHDPPPEGIAVDGDLLWLVPVVRGWSSKDDDELRAYLVADNRQTEIGGWHDDALARLLSGISESPAGLEGTGYNPDGLKQLLGALATPAPTLIDPDEVPEPPAEPVSKLGDVWIIGPHRVLCGDATVKEDYDRALGGERLAGAVATDPPYGVAIGAKNRSLDAIDRAGRALTDLSGDQGMEEVEALWRDSFAVLNDVMPPGTPYYIFGPQGGDLGLLLLLRDAGLSPRHILIWVKNRPSFSIGRLDYDYQHEPIVYGWRPGAAHPWYSTETQQSVLMFDRPQRSPDHPTVKPVGLMAKLIVNSVPLGGTVLDPFGGSGSTLIAAEQTGRVGVLMEISPAYTDLICRRFQEVFGTVPILESTGEAHSFVP